jgi:hypothetical protein
MPDWKERRFGSRTQMGKYTAHNLSVINKALGHGDGRQVMTQAIFDGLAKIAEDIMKTIDSAPPCSQSHEGFPVDTGNARQGTAVAIYVGGRVTVFRSQRDLERNEPQEWNGQLYWGKQQLELALKLGAWKFSEGVWFVLFSAQPYSAWLNEDHTAHIGFFDEYADEMYKLVKTVVASNANKILKGNFVPKSAGVFQNGNDDRSMLMF